MADLPEVAAWHRTADKRNSVSGSCAFLVSSPRSYLASDLDPSDTTGIRDIVVKAQRA